VTCQQSVSLLSAQCDFTFSAARYIDGMQVRNIYMTTGLVNQYIQLSVANTGEGHDTLPRAAMNPITGACDNALQALSFTVVHTGSGTITNVTVSITLGSVQPLADGSAALTQAFAITFATPVTGTGPLRARSGYYGYTVGSQVLSGSLVSMANNVGETKQAVLQSTRGIALPAPGKGGRCDGTANVSVAFGTAMQVCCTIALTMEELKSRCSASVDGALTYGIQNVIQAGTVVGIYGGSDRDQPVDWLSIPAVPEKDATAVRYDVLGWPGSSAYANFNETYTAWDSVSRTCWGIPGGIRLGFATAREGSVAHPAHRITNVLHEYVRTSWTWNEVTANSDGTHDFPVCYTTQFEEKSEVVDNTVLWIEADLVYPFLSYYDTWGMRWGVFNFLGCIFLLTPVVLPAWNLNMPVSSVRRLFTNANQ